MTDTIFAEGFIRELENETKASRRCLERIPENLYSWKPHEKSMEMGYLSLLVFEIPMWITKIIKTGEIDFATFQHNKLTTTEALVHQFDKNFEEAKKALKSIEDGDLSGDFYLKTNGQVLIKDTKRSTIESTINHLVHHRGQLTVYMRLNDIAVPSIYGPSADERSFNS